MTQHTVKIGLVLALAFCAVSALTAQDTPARLSVGVWSGDLTPMHHPDIHTPLQFAVSEAAGTLTMKIRGPDGLVLPTRDLAVSEAGVVFSFFEPEADVPLRCDLRFDDRGTLSGRCTDPNGKWASVTMRPPTGSAG